MKTIVVTGAGKGIGEGTVQEIISRRESFGAKLNLLITARTASDLTPLQSLARSHGVNCEILAVDLFKDPTAPIEAAISHFGRVDILIHSAGVGRYKKFLDLTQKDLEDIMNTNVHASFLLMQETYRKMKAQKSGHIVFITSVAAEKPFLECAAYCMSKYAQQGLIEVMRMYGYEDGIKITEVKPGAVATPMWDPATPSEMKEKMLTAQNVGRSIVDTILTSKNTSIEEIKIRPLHGDF